MAHSHPDPQQFAGQHGTALTLIAVFLSLVALLFLAVVVVSLASIFASLDVSKRRKEKNQ